MKKLWSNSKEAAGWNLCVSLQFNETKLVTKTALHCTKIICMILVKSLHKMWFIKQILKPDSFSYKLKVFFFFLFLRNDVHRHNFMVTVVTVKEISPSRGLYFKCYTEKCHDNNVKPADVNFKWMFVGDKHLVTACYTHSYAFTN